MFVAARVEKMDGVFPVDTVESADAAVEIEKVDAAAEEDVLAIVEDFAGLGIFIRTGASAEGFAGFDEGDGVAGGCECDGGGHAGQATSHDDHRFGSHRGYLERVARQAMRILAMVERETRWRRTRMGSLEIFWRMPW